ncbi:MAG: hypothetical protein NVS9B14_07030 [Candidatus Acidiferrum sp.]
MREDEKGSPKNRRADREMIVQMARHRSELAARLTGFVDAAFAKTCIGMLVVGGKVQIVLNQKRANVRVVAHAISANPGIGKRQRYQEKQDENALGPGEKTQFAKNGAATLH